MWRIDSREGCGCLIGLQGRDIKGWLGPPKSKQNEVRRRLAVS